jgi:hypothetical protein
MDPMNKNAGPIVVAALLAGCSVEPKVETTAAPGAPDSQAPVAAAAGPAAPAFRLPAANGGAETALADAIKDAGGKPLVLVLGSASCSYSTQEIDELAVALPTYALLAVVEGSAEEVRGSLPKSVPFPVLVDAGGKALQAYGVKATPSVVVLDGKGAVAFQGDGGYIPPAKIAEIAEKVARGEPVGKVETEGG